MNEFTLLKKEQTFGKKRINVIKKIGTRCAITDFAILLGGYVSEHQTLNDDTSIKGRTGAWYLSYDSVDSVDAVEPNGIALSIAPNFPDCGIRPILSHFNINDISSNVVSGKSGLLEVTYGEYPQYAVDVDLENILDAAFSNGRLLKTGKAYTTNSFDDSSDQFNPTYHEEYAYNGKRYVRVKNQNKKVKLSNNIIIEHNDYVWVEVSPITWYVDKKAKMLVSKILLASGIRFGDSGQYKGNFKTTEMYMFLNEYFAKDIVPSKLQTKEKTIAKPNNKSKSESLMEEIYEYCKDLPNGEELTKRIDDLANEYNEKLAKIYELKKNKAPTLETFSAITNDLELKLNMILDDLKKHHEKYKTYFEMIDIINEYIDVVNGSEKESNNELTSDLNTIISVCIPFLKAEDGNKLKQELLTILNNQKKEIADYLHTSSIFNSITPSKELKYNTIEEMNLDLRKKLHPLLKDLSTSVNKRDIELEIKESITKIINGLYSEPKNKLLSYYLNEINDVYTSIVNSLANIPLELQNEYKEKIASIMATKIDYNEDFITISKNLMKIWLSLNKVESEIEEIEVLKTAYIDTSKFKK